MCLTLRNNYKFDTEKLRKQISSGRRKYFWKVYEIASNEKLIAPCKRTRIKIRDGVIRSSRRSTKIREYEGEEKAVSKGIHFCITREKALCYSSSIDKIFRISIEPQDLVAVDILGKEAVATKIRIHDYKKPAKK